VRGWATRFNHWLLRRWPWSLGLATVAVIAASLGLFTLSKPIDPLAVVVAVMFGVFAFLAVRSSGRGALRSRREGLADADLAQVMTHVEFGGELDPTLRSDAVRYAEATKRGQWNYGLVLAIPLCLPAFLIAGWLSADWADEWPSFLAVGAAYAVCMVIFGRLDRRHRRHLEHVIARSA
jgi:hypothetical protein